MPAASTEQTASSGSNRDLLGPGCANPVDIVKRLGYMDYRPPTVIDLTEDDDASLNPRLSVPTGLLKPEKLSWQV
jgi:hypothetical protein